ncbi:MAG: transposase [Acidimicrobiales bacterium]
MRYRSTNKTVYSAKYHLVWCPKYRKPVLAGLVEARLKDIIADVARPGRTGCYPAATRQGPSGCLTSARSV